jgi:hypothetical protein
MKWDDEFQAKKADLGASIFQSRFMIIEGAGLSIQQSTLEPEEIL